MARNNPPQHHVADEDLPEVQDQGQGVVLADTVGDGAPDGGKEQDSQSDQELLPNPKALSPSQLEGQQLEDPTNLREYGVQASPQKTGSQPRGGTGYSLQSWLQHGHKKLSSLKPYNVDILVKILHSPGGEHEDGTKDP